MAVETKIGGFDDNDEWCDKYGIDLEAGKEGEDMLDLLKAHDKAVKDMLDTYSKIAEKNSQAEKAAPLITRRGRAVYNEYRKIIIKLDRDISDDEEFFAAASTLFKADDEIRVAHLNKITPNAGYVNEPDGVINQMTETLESLQEQEGVDEDGMRVHAALMCYANGLNVDISLFFQALQANEFLSESLPQSSPEEQSSEKTIPGADHHPSTIGKHILDIAKIAAGVGLGVALGDIVNRHKK